MSETPPTPWERAGKHRRALRSERQGAKLEGGRTQPNSGALPNRKGDYYANGFLVDDKVTEHRSWRLELDGPQGMVAHTTHAQRQRLLPSWRLTIDGHVFRVFSEEDALYLTANAQIGIDPDE